VSRAFLVTFEAPWSVTIRTPAGPGACAGASMTILRELLTRTSSARVPSTRTRCTPVKPRPLTTTSKPPAVVPVAGASRVILGLGFRLRAGWSSEGAEPSGWAARTPWEAVAWAEGTARPSDRPSRKASPVAVPARVTPRG
jgi:hypothetical protein